MARDDPGGAPPVGDLDFDELAASYVMSGGYIRNAVLRAAFLAADEQGPIDAQRLVRAAQLEYEALGKIAAVRDRSPLARGWPEQGANMPAGSYDTKLSATMKQPSDVDGGAPEPEVPEAVASLVRGRRLDSNVLHD